MNFGNLPYRFHSKNRQPSARPPSGSPNDDYDRRPSSSQGPVTPQYDYSLTRLVKFKGLILEHRRLNAQDGYHREACWPHMRDIIHLRGRVEQLGHTIVLETSEKLEPFRRKFGSVPGIIFITEFGRVVSRGDRQLVIDNFTMAPGMELEEGKLLRVLTLCNMADASRVFINEITSFEFRRCDIRAIPDTDAIVS